VTEAEICSLALGSVGFAGIASLDDATKEAQLCKRLYPVARDAVIETRLWSFARARYILDPAAEPPLFGWTYRFARPAEVLRVFRVDDGGGEYRIPWEIEGSSIYADVAKLYVLALKRVTDTAQFSSAFTMALAARLAAELAVPLTENSKLQERLWGLYEREVREAAGTDGSQGKSEQVKSTYLHRIRG
jgi:hypothetical protein